MLKNASSDSVQSKSSNQFNARLPQITHNQINNLVAAYGLTKTQVIIVAVDRFTRDLDAKSLEANNDVRRLKTVARIAPQFDLGRDE